MENSDSLQTSVPDKVISYSEKKNTSLPLLIASVVVITALLAGVLGYYLGSMQRTQPVVENNQPEQQPQVSATLQPKSTACTLEAKICPDGSSVGRIGPNCEFEECPIVEKTSMLRFIVPEKYKTQVGESRSLDIPAKSVNRAQPVDMTINGVTYQIQNTLAGPGMCPWGEEADTAKCEKLEQPFPNAEYLFIWKDAERGIFAFNTGNLKIGEVTSEVIMVSKKDQRGFTDSEFEMWKQMLQALELVEIK